MVEGASLSTDSASLSTDGPPHPPNGKVFCLTGVIFDFDGTLTCPGALDFAAVRRAVGCPPDVGLLEYLAQIADPEERSTKEAILAAAEADAAERCRVNPGAGELVAFLRGRGVPMAIITRNSRAAMDRALPRLPEISPDDFVVVVTRDLPVSPTLSPKPFPDGVEFVARELGLDTAGLLMIGDHAFDIEAGRRAGTLTMFLRNDPAESRADGGADFVVDTLEQALLLIGRGLPSRPN